jgi:hypothetical protein
MEPPMSKIFLPSDSISAPMPTKRRLGGGGSSFLGPDMEPPMLRNGRPAYASPVRAIEEAAQAIVAARKTTIPLCDMGGDGACGRIISFDATRVIWRGIIRTEGYSRFGMLRVRYFKPSGALDFFVLTGLDHPVGPLPLQEINLWENADEGEDTRLGGAEASFPIRLGGEDPTAAPLARDFGDYECRIEAYYESYGAASYARIHAIYWDVIVPEEVEGV